MAKPHKCPVCEGTGKWESTLPRTELLPIICHACSGTGIVWEPERPTLVGEERETCEVTTAYEIDTGGNRKVYRYTVK